MQGGEAKCETLRGAVVAGGRSSRENISRSNSFPDFFFFLFSFRLLVFLSFPSRGALGANGKKGDPVRKLRKLMHS